MKADGKDLLDTGKAFSVILVGMPGIVISSLMVGIGFIQDLTTVFSLKGVEFLSNADGHEDGIVLIKTKSIEATARCGTGLKIRCRPICLPK